MVGLTNLSADAELVNITTTYPYVALFTVVGSDAGTGFTEAAYASYARVNSTGDWAAPTGTSPSTITNNAALNFPACTNTGTAVVEIEIAWGMVNNPTAAISSTSLGAWDFLGNYAWQPFNCTLASPGVLTSDGPYTFANGDVVVMTAEYGGSLPTGFTAITQTYTVAGVSGTTFNLGVNTTSIGAGMIRKVVPQPIVANVQPIINSGSVVLSAA